MNKTINYEIGAYTHMSHIFVWFPIRNASTAKLKELMINELDLDTSESIEFRESMRIMGDHIYYSIWTSEILRKKFGKIENVNLEEN